MLSATLIKDPKDSNLGIENLLNDEEKTNFNIDSLVEVKEDLAFDIDPVGEITEYSRCPEINVSSSEKEQVHKFFDIQPVMKIYASRKLFM